MYSRRKKSNYLKPAAFVDEIHLECPDQTGKTASSPRKPEANAKSTRTPRVLRQSTISFTSDKTNSSQSKGNHKFAMPVNPSRTKKRPSDESLPDAIKQSRREEVSPAARSRDVSISRVSFGTNTSTLPSARNSFSTTVAGQSFISTVLSSIAPEDERGFESSSSSYGALDISETENLMTSFDHSCYRADSFEAGLRKLSSRAITAGISSSQKTIKDAGLGNAEGLHRTDSGTREVEVQPRSSRYQLRSNDQLSVVKSAKTTPIQEFLLLYKLLPATLDPRSLIRFAIFLSMACFLSHCLVRCLLFLSHYAGNASGLRKLCRSISNTRLLIQSVMKPGSMSC